MKKNLQWLICCFITGSVILLTAYSGSRAISTISENTPISRKHCLVIDPGHGGEDGGATSCTGILESQLNLEIALRLNDLFHLLGYDTKLTRTEDISIYTRGESLSEKKISDLKERVRIVNETDNSILLSIHQNNFGESQYKGPQVFFADTAKSQQLAKQLQTALNSNLRIDNGRNTKKSSGIYLLDRIQKPGILLECGFLSNPEEESQLRSPAYQKQLCCIVVSSVCNFLSNT